MRHLGASLAAAASDVLAECAQRGGTGGLIAVGHDGAIVLPFNSPGMYRAWFDGARTQVGIYRELER